MTRSMVDTRLAGGTTIVSPASAGIPGTWFVLLELPGQWIQLHSHEAHELAAALKATAALADSSNALDDAAAADAAQRSGGQED